MRAAVDPDLGSAWHLAGDAPMGAVSAWAQTAGAGVTVAVLDTGVDLRQPDLAGALWTDPVTGAHGIDLVDGDNDPSDEQGHGTHVAGLIAARANNGIGSAGIAPAAQIMAVRVLDENAAGDARTVAEGVRWAVAHGAKILNLSLAGPSESKELEQAIAEARDAGALVVAAAGNQSSNLALTPAYPASSPSPNVLAVAATDQDGGLADVSNFGGATDLAAPGELLVSTAMGGGSELRTGTSMAAPLVAGTAALVASVRPGADWTVLDAALRAGARRSALPVGSGTLDAAGALRQVIPAAAWRTPPASRDENSVYTPAPAPAVSSSTAVAKRTTAAATKARKAAARRARAKRARARKAAGPRRTSSARRARTARSAARRDRGPLFRAA